MKKQDKMKIETKYTWKDVDSGSHFPVYEAKHFVERIRPYLIEKPINRILIHSFYHCCGGYNTTETLPEWVKRHGSMHGLEEENPLILLIGNEQLEVTLTQPSRYFLGFNTIQLQKIIDASKVSLRSIFKAFNVNSPTYYDISSVYANNLIGQKIKDIKLTTEFYDEKCLPEDEYFEDISILLENGKILKILNEVDSATIRIESNENGG